MSPHCCQVKRMLYNRLSSFYPSMYRKQPGVLVPASNELFSSFVSDALVANWSSRHCKERTNASCDNRACKLVSILMWLLEQIPPWAAIPRMNTKTPRCERKCGHATKGFIIGMQLQRVWMTRFHCGGFDAHNDWFSWPMIILCRKKGSSCPDNNSISHLLDWFWDFCLQFHVKMIIAEKLLKLQEVDWVEHQ
jgi:hypothetical protein